MKHSEKQHPVNLRLKLFKTRHQFYTVTLRFTRLYFEVIVKPERSLTKIIKQFRQNFATYIDKQQCLCVQAELCIRECMFIIKLSSILHEASEYQITK